ncbi:hypothetical protein OSB04_018909 [Centaurea solstitialis]|uniref:Desiccation-related protein PCC13-62 n=1 Tax=Centaurea solstitialis TaxID=347529 RepID=A0AA38WFD0_9ASTR|nr:hypothetical protein OSB04_018909 [Centaurea solstitialis]
MLLSSSTVGLMMIKAYLIFLFTFATVNSRPILPASDSDLTEFPLNLEYLEAEYFLFASMGRGLDSIRPDLADGGPPPIGAKKANLTSLTNDIITQFAYQEIGHIRAIKKVVKGFPRPLLNLSAESFAKVINDAFGEPLSPPFDPYSNDINYLISCYIIPYVGLTGYVGANPKLVTPISKQSSFIKMSENLLPSFENLRGLLGVEGGQDAVFRTLLYERAKEKVTPYEMTVADFTNKISGLRNKLGKNGVKDEGLIVPLDQGAEKKVEGNVLSADEDSISYGRTPEEILRILYGTGAEGIPGGFYPKGADGAIAKRYLRRQNE